MRLVSQARFEGSSAPLTGSAALFKRESQRKGESEDCFISDVSNSLNQPSASKSWERFLFVSGLEILLLLA